MSKWFCAALSGDRFRSLMNKTEVTVMRKILQRLHKEEIRDKMEVNVSVKGNLILDHASYI